MAAGSPSPDGAAASDWPRLNPVKRHTVFARLTELKTEESRDVTVGDLIKTIQVGNTPPPDGTIVHGGLLIGRRNTTLFPPAFNSRVLSRSHVQLLIDNVGRLYVIDVGSMHGTRIARRYGAEITVRPQRAVVVRNGDVLIFGKRIPGNDGFTHKPLRVRVDIRYEPAEHAAPLRPGQFPTFATSHDLINIDYLLGRRDEKPRRSGYGISPSVLYESEPEDELPRGTPDEIINATFSDSDNDSIVVSNAQAAAKASSPTVHVPSSEGPDAKDVPPVTGRIPSSAAFELPDESPVVLPFQSPVVIDLEDMSPVEIPLSSPVVLDFGDASSDAGATNGDIVVEECDHGLGDEPDPAGGVVSSTPSPQADAALSSQVERASDDDDIPAAYDGVVSDDELPVHVAGDDTGSAIDADSDHNDVAPPIARRDSSLEAHGDHSDDCDNEHSEDGEHDEESAASDDEERSCDSENEEHFDDSEDEQHCDNSEDEERYDYHQDWWLDALDAEDECNCSECGGYSSAEDSEMLSDAEDCDSCESEVSGSEDECSMVGESEDEAGVVEEGEEEGDGMEEDWQEEDAMEDDAEVRSLDANPNNTDSSVLPTDAPQQSAAEDAGYVEQWRTDNLLSFSVPSKASPANGAEHGKTGTSAPIDTGDEEMAHGGVSSSSDDEVCLSEDFKQRVYAMVAAQRADDALSCIAEPATTERALSSPPNEVEMAPVQRSVASLQEQASQGSGFATPVWSMPPSPPLSEDGSIPKEHVQALSEKINESLRAAPLTPPTPGHATTSVYPVTINGRPAAGEECVAVEAEELLSAPSKPTLRKRPFSETEMAADIEVLDAGTNTTALNATPATGHPPARRRRRFENFGLIMGSAAVGAVIGGVGTIAALLQFAD